jgi:hypothetical protein
MKTPLTQLLEELTLIQTLPHSILDKVKEYKELEKEALKDAFWSGQLAKIDTTVANTESEAWFDKTYTK